MPDQNVVVWGQSNVITYLNSGPAPYTPSDRVQILDIATGQLEGLDPGVNAGTANNPADWGPIVQYANEWLSENPTGTLRFAEIAHGSTPLAQDPNGLDWSPASTGELYDQLKAAAAQLVALTGHPIDVVLGMQGEQDATAAASATAYQANELDLIAHMRADFASVGTAFVFGRIDEATGLADVETVRAAQDAVANADGMVFSVNTDAYPLRADNLHFDEPGVVQLGHDMYELATYGDRSTTGTAGPDAITGASGNDSFSAGQGDDTLYGEAGNDWLHGNGGDDVIQGNAGNDTVYGGQGDDRLYGGQGDDFLCGDLGNDTLYAGKGDDTTAGGAGADTFVIAAGGGHDVLVDFSLTDGDRLHIDDGSLFTARWSGADTLVTLADGSTLDIQNAHLDLSGAGWIV